MTESIDAITRIDSISNFDRAEIDYLLECWCDRSLNIRYRAYCKLNSADCERQILSSQERELISKGIFLAVDDPIWSVYQSGLSYDDNWYAIHDRASETGENVYRNPAEVAIYDLWNRGIAHKFISTHIDRASAEVSMHQTIKEILIRNQYPYSGYYDLDLQVEEISQQDIYNFTQGYNIPDLELPKSSRPITKYLSNGDDNYDYDDDSPWMEQDRLRDYAIDILQKLTVDENYELIDKIYSTLFGRLAYICKETVKEPTYFIP